MSRKGIWDSVAQVIQHVIMELLNMIQNKNIKPRYRSKLPQLNGTKIKLKSQGDHIIRKLSQNSRKEQETQRVVRNKSPENLQGMFVISNDNYDSRIDSVATSPEVKVLVDEKQMSNSHKCQYWLDKYF